MNNQANYQPQDYLYHQVTVSLVSHALDNEIRESVTVTWGEFLSWIANHEVREDKTEGALFTTAAFEDREGAGFIRRCAENVTHYSGLILDFDGGLSIDEARERYRGYTYAGYTSHSHRSPKKGNADCYRLIFPLACEVTPDDIRERRESLAQFIKGADPSSLSIARVFYTPSCPASTRESALSWSNTGTLLNVYDFIKLPPLRVHTSPDHATRYKDNDELTDAKREELVERLSNYFVGYEPTWHKVAVACASNGFTLEQFYRITAGMMREKTPHDAQKEWHKAQAQVSRNRGGIHYAFLFNVLKGRYNRG